MERTGWLAAAVACMMAGIAWAQPKDTIYDEAQVPDYTLPDPLVMQDGMRIIDAAGWRSNRKPEILGLFQAHVYGRAPAAAPKIAFKVTSLDANALGGKATRKEVEILLLGKQDGPRMDLLLYLPNGASKTVPAFSVARAEKQYEANWEVLEGYPVPQWFDDAKFGIFIHWGGYSVMGYTPSGRGYAEHSPKNIYREPQRYYPVVRERFGAHPPEFGYKEMLGRFKAEKWDPEGWARLFDEAGAKYVVLTAEHHDGFALWDSALTDWCATKVGPMRDLVGELGAAVRKRGLKYAPSYHRERHPGFFARDLYAIASEPHPDIAEEIRRMPAAEGLYGPFRYSDEFLADYVARWKELQDRYRPDFMWIDDIPIFYRAQGDPQTLKFRQACAGMIADYFNAAQEWGKEVYLNNKGGNPNWPVSLGCLEKDNLQMDRIGVKWENPATLGTSYGYLQAEEQRDLYQTPTKLVHLLCDVVSKNGNLLLNIGPRADGIIPEGMQSRLLAIGQWLGVNGEAIYGTRPWKIFGEGVVPLQAKRDELGRHTINSSGIRFTRSQRGGTVYAILLERPQQVTIESFQGQPVRRVELLGSQEQVRWEVRADGLRATLPETKPCKHAFVLKIFLN